MYIYIYIYIYVYICIYSLKPFKWYEHPKKSFSNTILINEIVRK